MDTFDFERIFSAPSGPKGWGLTAAAVLGDRLLLACDDGALRIAAADGRACDALRCALAPLSAASCARILRLAAAATLSCPLLRTRMKLTLPSP